MSTNGKRNKNAGHAWEREIVNMLKKLGFEHLVTTRSESRGRDAQKVDIMNKDERENGRFPYNIQAKSLSKPAPYPKILSEVVKTDGVINVVFHKQTQKSEGGRFMTRGTYAILDLLDFTKMMDKIRRLQQGFEEVMKYVDFIPDEERKELDERLNSLGL